eukprot:TRINITY_DN2065_c0_g1_i1.p1 TRINITY_DN2065_c0_g1~~TRINITY_DN2065_c0_g1_i1.p1  ORF type:complete len:259 (-),score=24.29 TRINITY_DN2065_c0_g1_i1:124-900(-)
MTSWITGYSDFEWIQGVSPLADPWLIGYLCVGYTIAVGLLRYVSPHPPTKFPRLQAAHNFLLCGFSLFMLVGVVTQLVSELQAGFSFQDVLCDSQHRNNRGTMYFFIWLFHLSKIYEFVDTLFLCLSKSRLRFLHVYHHVLTLVITFWALSTYMTLQWWGVMTNTFIHTLMYWYYGWRSLNVEIWWKVYLTRLQIIQFCSNIIVGVAWFYWSTVSGLNCSGSETWLPFALTMFANVTFLYLFIQMYKSTYNRKGSKVE